jgi:mRNA-degrading endonuclease HigB of HigAB toxin-antitoxin module
MHVIARATLRSFAEQQRDAREWLENWWSIASRAGWRSLSEVRRTYLATDQVGGCLVFNCKGNTYRLIVRVSYANEHSRGTLFVKHFLTHAESSKGRWKEACR